MESILFGLTSIFEAAFMFCRSEMSQVSVHRNWMKKKRFSITVQTQKRKHVIVQGRQDFLPKFE